MKRISGHLIGRLAIVVGAITIIAMGGAFDGTGSIGTIAILGGLGLLAVGGGIIALRIEDR